MGARIERLAVLIAGLCVGSGCGLLLGIQDIEKPAGAEAGNGGEAGGSWCDRNGAGHLFCEDFDRGDSRFGSPAKIGNGVLTTADDVASSPPKALLAVCSPSADTSTAAASWSSRSKLTDVSIALDVRIEQTSTPAQLVQFVKFVFDDAEQAAEIGLGFAPGKGGYGFEYDDKTVDYSEFVDAFTLPTGTWVHVALAIHTSSVDRATVDVDVEGTSVSKGVPLAHPLKPGSANALVGIAYVPADHPGWKVRIDNVLIDGT